jgi:hypothetical protein
MGIMAASINKPFRAWLLGLALVAAASLGRPAQGQSSPLAVPVPFTTSIAGTGGVGVTTCTSGIPTTSGASYGDACAAAVSGLAAPQGAAVDKYGNVYVADYTDRLVRVIYNGGTNLAAAITSANSGYSISSTRSAPAPTPVVGDIYTIAGFGGTSIAALTVSSTDGSGKFACANYAASGQPDALNSLGDGCPAASAPIGPRDVTVDSDGNLFLTDYTDSRVRVLCVNCYSTAPATRLIELEEPGVTPVNGAMYTIAGYAGGYRDGYLGFGNAIIASSSVALLRSPTAAVVSSSDDVYIADNLNNAVRLLYNGGTAAKNILTGEGITPTLGYVYTIAGAGCVSAATNKTGSVVTANSCLTTKGSDTATLGNALGVDVAWTVYLDPNNNVYFTDAGNARVKVIYGGVAAPLTLPNSTYAALQTGYAYSFAGEGASTQSGVRPGLLALSSAQGVGGDMNGNIFFDDYTTGLFYETYAQTGLTAIIGGGNASSAPSAGAYCNSGSSGPAMIDAYFDGCPLTQATIANPRGPIVADASGNLYFGDSPGSLLRKFTYYPAFPATAVGASSAAQPYAFTFLSAEVLAASTITDGGAPSTAFSDTGADTCTPGLAAVAGAPGTTCVVNLAFTPQQPGLRAGAVEINSATGTLGSSLFSGVGVGAGLAIDPGTTVTTGTNLVPGGIAVDGAGRVLVSDDSSKSVLRYTGGVAATVASGFSSPSGVAVDGAGNLFVADSAANTITELPVSGTKFILTSSVNDPHGLATDGAGNLYIADTGNNRVLVFGPGATLAAVAGFTGLVAPRAVAVDSGGNLYAADSTHVVKLTPAGVQSTIASGSSTGVAVDAGGDMFAFTDSTLIEYSATGGTTVTVSSALVSPKAVTLDAAGNAYVADSGLGGYLEIERTAGAYQFASNSASTPITLTSSGNSSLTQPTYMQSDSTDFSLASATADGCSGALAAGSVCILTASFNPTLPGTLTDNVTFASNATNGSPISLTLTGTTAAQATSTTLKTSSAALVYGNVETLTATVTGSASAPGSGSVSFYNNVSTLLGSASVGSNGVAAFSFLPTVAAYSVTAVFTPSGTGYFTSTSSAQTYSVTTATLTVTATNASRFYNSANPAFAYSISGFVNGDTQSSATTGSPNETTAAILTSPVGSYPIAITQGSLASANYTFVFINGTLTITGATAQTITFAALPNTIYGVAPIVIAATASSGQPVSYTVTGPATVSGSTLTIIGAGAVSVTAAQSGNNTYAAAPSVTQSFVVAQATLSVAASSTSRVYGSANPALTYTITGFVNSDSQTTATTGAPAESTTASASSNVGGYPITLAQGTLAATNYTFILSSGTLAVTPATLTLNASNAARTYGAANPVFSGTISGVVNGDQLTETFSTPANISSGAGTYPIVPGASGANVGNYTPAATDGSLTITLAKPVIVLSTSASSGFSGTTSITLTATFSSPTSGVPTGTVTFYSGTAVVGVATISGAAAALTTTALPLGPDSVTAIYSGDANFSIVTSSTILITIAPSFDVTSSSTALAFSSASYQEAQAFLTINPGGRTDTLSFACQGLPEKLSCAFNPSTLPLAGVTSAQSVQLLVSNSSATSSLGNPRIPGLPGAGTLAFAGLPFAAILFFGRRRMCVSMLILCAVLALAVSSGLSGCGSSAVSFDQGPGTYNFNVTVDSGSTALQTIPFTLTIP